jgi:hypothetical protein
MESKKLAFSVAQSAYSNVTPKGLRKNKALSDRRSKVYDDGAGNVWFGIRGTNPWNAGDLLADFHILTGTRNQSRRFIETREKLDLVKEFYGKDAKINISAHSLGGSQGRYLAERESGINSAYLYNAGYNPRDSFRDSLYDKVGFSQKKNNTKIKEYKTLSDPISFGGFFPKKDTKIIYVPVKKGLNPHDLQNFG